MRRTLTVANRNLMSFAPLTSVRALIVDAHSSAHQCSKTLKRSVRRHRKSMRQSVISDARNLARHCYGPRRFMYDWRIDFRCLRRLRSNVYEHWWALLWAPSISARALVSGAKTSEFDLLQSMSRASITDALHTSY